MTLADYTVIGVVPDLTEAEFVAILDAARSPALGAASAVWNYCRRRGVSPAFLLAMFRHESRFGTQGTATQTRSWGNTRSPSFGGVREMGTVPGRSGTFPVFKDWIDGGISTAARWLDHAPYQGKRTVRQIIPVWAPASDGNSPEAYIAAVLASIAEWTKGAPPVALTKPPVVSNPSPNHGYPGDYRPEAVVWHITAGSGASALNWLTNPASNASANYVITEDGAIHELVNPEAGQQGAAWANGDVQKPNLGNPTIAGWVKSGINPNRRCVSIEHAGQSSMGEGGSLTAAQVAATIKLTAWLCQRFGIAPDQDHILGHYQINDVDRHYCPGFSAAEWAEWVNAVAQTVHGAPPAPPPPAPAPSEPGAIRPYLNAKGETIIEINLGGAATVIEGINIQDAGATVRNAKGERYSRSVRANVLQPWQAHQ